MSCSENFSAHGRRGIGPIQPQSGLDYPLIGFETLTDEQKIARALSWPVRAIIVGGAFTLKLQPPTPPSPPDEPPPPPPPPPFYIHNLSPAWPDPAAIDSVRPVVNSVSSGASVSGNYVSNINAAIAYYAVAYPDHSISVYSATIELALVDNKNLVVGWGTAEDYTATVTIGHIPKIHSPTSFFARWQNYRKRNCGVNCATSDVVNPPWSLVNDNEIRYLFADFYLEYDDPGNYGQGQTKLPPFRIKYCYGAGCIDNPEPTEFFNPTHDVDLVIVDAADNVVADTSVCSFSVDDSNPDYNIYTWCKTGELQFTCRAAIYKTWKYDDGDRKDYCRYAQPQNALLVERTIQKLPKRLLTLYVKNKNSPLPAVGPIAGDITFKNNYNTVIAASATTTTGFIVNTNVNFSFVAGTGIGYYPECGSNYDKDTKEPLPQPIRRVNGVGASTAGDFLLAGKDCLFVRRPTEKIDDAIYPSTTAGMKVGADCRPCCECSDYVNAALYMNQIQAQYSLIGSRVNALKLVHEQNIARWQDRRACSLQHPLKLIFVPQNCPIIDVVAMICNPCNSACLPNSTLNILLETVTGSSVELVCGYTALFAPGVNGRALPIEIGPTLTGATQILFKMPSVSAGASAYVKFRLRFSPRTNYTVRGVLTGNIDDPARTPIRTGCAGETPDSERLVASASAAQDLYCNDAGETDTAC